MASSTTLTCGFGFSGESPRGSQQCGHSHGGKECQWNMNKAALMEMTGGTLRGDAVGDLMQQVLNTGVLTKRKAEESEPCLHQGKLHLGKRRVKLCKPCRRLCCVLYVVIYTEKSLGRTSIPQAATSIEQRSLASFKERPTDVCLQSKEHCKRESPSWPLRQRIQD